MSHDEMKEFNYDRLWKVLAPDLAVGFTKVDLVEFLPYLQEKCNLEASLLTEANIEKVIKATGLKNTNN